VNILHTRRARPALPNEPSNRCKQDAGEPVVLLAASASDLVAADKHGGGGVGGRMVIIRAPGTTSAAAGARSRRQRRLEDEVAPELGGGPAAGGGPGLHLLRHAEQEQAGVRRQVQRPRRALQAAAVQVHRSLPRVTRPAARGYATSGGRGDDYWWCQRACVCCGCTNKRVCCMLPCAWGTGEHGKTHVCAALVE
jgi:hypothetical protein